MMMIWILLLNFLRIVVVCVSFIYILSYFFTMRCSDFLHFIDNPRLGLHTARAADFVQKYPTECQREDV